MSKQPACPECERLSAVNKRSEPIGQFLDWLQNEKHLKIAKYMMVEDDDLEDGDEEGLVECGLTIEQLLADYFRIDLYKVEKERQALLKWLQEENL